MEGISTHSFSKIQDLFLERQTRPSTTKASGVERRARSTGTAEDRSEGASTLPARTRSASSPSQEEESACQEAAGASAAAEQVAPAREIELTTAAQQQDDPTRCVQQDACPDGADAPMAIRQEEIAACGVETTAAACNGCQLLLQLVAQARALDGNTIVG